MPQFYSPGCLQKLQEDILIAQSLVFLKESNQSSGTPRPSKGLHVLKELEKLGVQVISGAHQCNSTNILLSPLMCQAQLDIGGGGGDEAAKMKKAYFMSLESLTLIGKIKMRTNSSPYHHP